MQQPHKLVEKIEQLNNDAHGHKKAVRFHRRKLKECKSLIEELKNQLAQMGIEIQSQGGSNGKETTFNPRNKPRG
jgi:uncharacterized coiled-coil DUF342 family protein